MIVFDLICSEQHRFEGWFASGEDFASQKGRGLLECPICGVVHVEKLPAAKIRTQTEQAAEVPAQANSEDPVTLGQSDVWRAIDYILSHSEDVGKNFVEEARKIHYHESPQRSIRGVATPVDAEGLREEGIAVFTLPVPPQDRWN